MAACIHGEVCRAWMELTGSIAPLTTRCPMGCAYYRPKPKRVLECEGTLVEVISDGKVRVHIGSD